MESGGRHAAKIGIKPRLLLRTQPPYTGHLIYQVNYKGADAFDSRIVLIRHLNIQNRAGEMMRDQKHTCKQTIRNLDIVTPTYVQCQRHTNDRIPVHM